MIENFIKKVEERIYFNKSFFESIVFFKLKNKLFYYEIKPIKGLYFTSFNDLLGIDNIKNAVYENTKKFVLTGRTNNVLLWGERGCGKSSLIRSVVWEFKDYGLKLIQVKKSELPVLEDLIDYLIDIEDYKFIVLLDDLSFKEEDDLFLELKSVLDTAIVENSGNVIIYATSNRRHLIEEKFLSDNIMHETDKISELISLSDRFGLSFGFYKFNKEQYLEIVKNYAKKYGIENKINIQEAINFAMKKGGFTGRAAYQYIISLI